MGNIIDNAAGSWLALVLTAATGAAGGCLILFLILVRSPEKIEIWVSLLWRAAARFELLFRGAHRRYVKHDLQGRLTAFAKAINAEVPQIDASSVRVDWIDPKSDRTSFLEQGKVVIRLRRDDRNERNFVHGAYWFVSASLLPRVKRYISQSQRKSLDLYVTSKLIEREKTSVRALFLDEYLHREAGDPTTAISQLINTYAIIDRSGFFYPVLLQELAFVGDKVFGNLRDAKIITEINALISHLERTAQRVIGNEVDLEFCGEYCRYGIVIVGKSIKLAAHGSSPYANYICNTLVPLRAETLYLIGHADNAKYFDEVCDQIADHFEVFRRRELEVTLYRSDGSNIRVRNVMITLRSPHASIIQASYS